jgi:hypothetical protein
MAEWAATMESATEARFLVEGEFPFTALTPGRFIPGDERVGGAGSTSATASTGGKSEMASIWSDEVAVVVTGLGMGGGFVGLLESEVIGDFIF